MVQPLRIEPALVFRFYPESGHLLEGVPNRLTFEVCFGSLAPNGYTGHILEDGKPLVAIRTDQGNVGAAMHKGLMCMTSILIHALRVHQ